VRDALRLHQVYRNKVLEDLRSEIAKGWDGPLSTRSVSEIIEAKRKEQESK
jgi:antitoxin ParD1/3/4